MVWNIYKHKGEINHPRGKTITDNQQNIIAVILQEMSE